jgi:hypothetical protein
MSGFRDERGRFTAGNPGGPGRPHRAVEREYLAVLGDGVSLDDWRAIVGAAVEGAKAGDARAREWLARYLLGETTLTLTDLAADELSKVGPEHDIGATAYQRQEARARDEVFKRLGSYQRIESLGKRIESLRRDHDQAEPSDAGDTEDVEVESEES